MAFKGLDWDFNVDEYDDQGTSRHTLRSMRVNEKQGNNGPKVNERVDPSTVVIDTGDCSLADCAI